MLKDLSFEFRHTKLSEVGRIVEIIEQAKQQMYREGKRQWNEKYPLASDIINDIEHDYAYVICSENTIVAYAAVVFDGEPAYDLIKGEWLSNNTYVVVHRLAVADEMKRKGIAVLYMKEVEKLCVAKGVNSFKVDTNFDNFYMQKVLKNCGFSYCGEIYYEHGSRLAYEKLLSL